MRFRRRRFRARRGIRVFGRGRRRRFGRRRSMRFRRRGGAGRLRIGFRM